MATFQVVYDDFSGGQYMGFRPANQPKNTWTGTDVLANANGELIPSGTRTVGTWAQPSFNYGIIVDHFYENLNGYFFTSANRFVKYVHNNGTAFPVTFTAYTTTGTGALVSATYSELHSRFYYLLAGGGGSGSVYSMTLSGTSALFYSIPSGQYPSEISVYKQRLVYFGKNRLYYSGVWNGTQYGAFTTGQYYEFDSNLIAVFPRTDDLLVICQDGTYSMTGVLGSGVTIQTLTPGENVSAGMGNGAIVNRSLLYLDESNSNGSIDGRLYRMIGASIQHVASFDYGDYEFKRNGFNIADPGRVTALPNGRVAIQFRSGYTYFESTPGVFARSKVFTITEDATSRTVGGYYRVARSMSGAPDEYILTAVVDPSIGATNPISIYRTYTNVPGPTKLDANFNYSTDSNCTVDPTGTVELSEYFHNKPFSVKEVFIEYSVLGSTSTVSCNIVPTGVVDVPIGTLPSVVSSTSTETNATSGGYRMYRYWPNNAAKGFGVKPQLTITNTFIKRVILNCED